VIVFAVDMPTLDLVIPVYNEQEGIRAFHQSLAAVKLPDVFARRYIYVDDGSTDETANLLEQLASSDSQITVIRLSRNFGHQAALTAGLDAAQGDVVVTMDGDGQHPASLIPEMLKLHVAGYDIVQAQRMDLPESSGLFKRSTSRMFYRLLSVIGEVRLNEGVSDFRLLSRRALDAVRLLPEYHRFLRGMAVWIGFPSVMIPYHPASRVAGSPKYSLRKMLRLAGDGLFSFSLFPLRIALFLGAAFIVLAAFELGYITSYLLEGRRSELVPGWASIILIMTVGTAVNLIILGILGVYIGMIFREVKRRPVYIVRSRVR
jgi:polyisoprenyl-phosphate glycosyltransferase